ncbi:TOBE domain-containing protein [Flavobacterium agrisoli]|uniref:TOBE domain-containing protein n=1 Tax=Flavobacterium agrisoli TaxID=2793066 RepID=A0A934PQ65_9FLAO|nr:TOBE domain-containing protein [Flavobacterium agrisoli]MBK0371063.1 TOBE domain-containing protein [Flavobacterium agrisoli]
MNSLLGNIINITTDSSLSLVQLKVQNIVLTTIVIDTPETSNYLKVGNCVKVLFKETEVILAKNISGIISLQNKIDCVVRSFEKGKLLCKIVLHFGDSKITSVITRNAFDQLEIQENDIITVLIKTNEISLAHD